MRSAVERAMGFLASATETRVGGQALAGLVFVKEGKADHPKVLEAISACERYANESSVKLLEENEFYNLPLATIFLCELDAAVYRGPINRMLAVMVERQQSGGGWGYVKRPDSGDTSMSQYCVLAGWTAHRSGLKVSPEMMEKACKWLVRTQSPNGSWGYQASDPGEGNYTRIVQSQTRLSMAAAGCGSVYICLDLFGLNGKRRVAESQQIPKAFRPVAIPGSGAVRRIGDARLANLIRTAAADGSQYIDANFEIAPVLAYPYYYLYALERYFSFRAFAEGDESRQSHWYDAGVEHLLANQASTGAWLAKGGQKNIVPSTAFGALFLLRSSKKSIKSHLGEGLLHGGRGLPSDLARARLRNGQLVGAPQPIGIPDFVSILEDPKHARLDDLEEDAAAALVGTGKAIDDAEAERLRRLVRGGDYRVRRLAVTALAERHNFDDFPILIYALSDPDDRVSLAARDALRTISRRFGGFDMSDTPSEAEKAVTVEKWKAWYREVNPTAEFVDGD